VCECVFVCVYCGMLLLQLLCGPAQLRFNPQGREVAYRSGQYQQQQISLAEQQQRHPRVAAAPSSSSLVLSPRHRLTFPPAAHSTNATPAPATFPHPPPAMHLTLPTPSRPPTFAPLADRLQPVQMEPVVAGGIGWHRATVQMPTDAHVLDLAFIDSADTRVGRGSVSGRLCDKDAVCCVGNACARA
jgi:hypothetical protein